MTIELEKAELEKKLLDLLKYSKENYKFKFNRNSRNAELTDEDIDGVYIYTKAMAQELLTNWNIKSAVGSLHSIESVEFYLVIPDYFEDHKDCGGACHGRLEQLNNGMFYVHTKSKKVWAPPIFNRHGIDITIGDIEQGVYGGILLRHLGGDGNRDGSGIALRTLLRGNSGFEVIKQKSNKFGWTEEEKKKLQMLNGASIFSNNVGVHLVKNTDKPIKKFEIISAERKGVEKTIFANLKLRYYKKIRVS